MNLPTNADSSNIIKTDTKITDLNFFNFKFFLGGFSEFLSFQVSLFPNYRVSKFLSIQVSKWEGGREGGPNRGLGTDHVISGPMRGQKKLHPMAQRNSWTWRLCDWIYWFQMLFRLSLGTPPNPLNPLYPYFFLGGGSIWRFDLMLLTPKFDIKKKYY